MLFTVLAHINSSHGIGIVKDEFCQSFAKLGF